MGKIFREFIYLFSVVNVFFVFNTVVEYKRDAQISKKRNITVQLFMIAITYILVREIRIWEIYTGSGFIPYRKMVFRDFLIRFLSMGEIKGYIVVRWMFNIPFLLLLAKVYKKEYNISCIKSAFLFVMTTKYLSLICDVVIPRILFIIWKKDSISKVYKKEYNISCIKSAFLFVMTTKYLSLICDVVIPRILFIIWKKDSISSDMVTKLSLQEWNWFDFSVILIAFLVFLFMLGIVKIIKKLVNNNRVYVYGINILLMNVIILFVLEFLNVISIGKIGFIYGKLLTSERHLLQIQVLPDLIFLNLIMTIYLVIMIKKENDERAKQDLMNSKLKLQEEYYSSLEESQMQVIYLVIMIKKENDERAKQDLMNSKLKLQEEYYSSLEESQMQVRKLYHDMKNHLENISNLDKNNEKSRQYIDELKDQLSNSNDVKSTGNAIVDIILNEKKKVCIREGIDFEINVNSKDLSFMKNADISNNNEKSRQYIDELKDQLSNSNDVKSTGNAIVDIILNEKKKVCIKEVLDFETNVNSKDLSFMKNADISNIFSNVLNNAIEACQKIENRKIKAVYR